MQQIMVVFGIRSGHFSTKITKPNPTDPNRIELLVFQFFRFDFNLLFFMKLGDWV